MKNYCKIVLLVSVFIILAGCAKQAGEVVTPAQIAEPVRETPAPSGPGAETGEEPGGIGEEPVETIEEEKETPVIEKETPPEVIKGLVYEVMIYEGKFEPSKLSIERGDTVVWKNARQSGSTPSREVSGVMATIKYRYIESPKLYAGDTFSYTFINETGTITFIDYIRTSLVFKLTVSG